ncbi:MAG TPA: IS1634 family transposase [Jatrophihabitantaceae bacterium]|nr:IS1634 family transposase [Jatrophihabitantaceae bacterium]
MASRFVRRVRTASGAVAVQIVDKVGGDVVAVEHIGSAHTDAELALLLSVARERLHPGQGELDLGALPEVATRTEDVADWTRREPVVDNEELAFDAGESGSGARPPLVAGGGRVVGTSSLLLWEVLGAAYDRLGFDALDDAAFKALVLGRIVEPTSKADTIRVLGDLGVPAPSLRTIFRTLTRCIERDYRDTLAKACLAHSASTTAGRASLVLYDVTTLWFEIENEDKFRKVGMSKERRVDPQIQVGLLVDPAGFPLEVHCFEGNTAETRTLIPVLQAFQERHGISDMVVVADAGMLSAANLLALEDAGFAFIVGSRISKAPYDLAEHFQRKGDYFADGQILESARMMGTGKNARERRVVYQFSRKRSRRDDRAINAMVERAEKVAAGTRPVKKDRFVTLDGADKAVDWALVDRARRLAGLKGYVTNIPVATMAGQSVISAYHDLWQVEKSFRMTKSDLRARPVFHHQRDSIEAHLTIVFAALAISRHLQDAASVSIRKIVTTLRSARSAIIRINGQRMTLEPDLTPAARELLTALGRDPGN